ncbi:hypothetical protein F5887DRAFT_1076420 [Amanita rubescens]|nr:hypothetical protein F5887DRAFT_1076420 [Amanita rubescens]
MASVIAARFLTHRKQGVKAKKSSDVIDDMTSLSDGQENLLDKAHQNEIVESDNEQPLLETVKSKKKKTVRISSDDESIPPIVDNPEQAVPGNIGETDTVLKMSDDPFLLKVKKPNMWSLHAYVEFTSSIIHTARCSKDNLCDKSSTSNVTNDFETFFDSDIDGLSDGVNHSEGMHSTHSLKSRTPTKTPTKVGSKHNTPLYLGSLPEIVDSGIKRNKDIQMNPFILDEELIDPLLRDDHKTLPKLRNTDVIQFVRYGQPRPEPSSNVALGYEQTVLKINAVFLTTGLIVESQLSVPADSTINPGHKIRQVLLLPFGGEIQRLLAYIGTVFETDEFVCLLESGSLILTTRRDGAGANYNFASSSSASSSPVRSQVPAGLLSGSPVKVSTSANANTKGKSSHFPPSLGFKDNVPVYSL